MRDALKGLKVIDLSVNAPGPFASMMLADMGAEVTTVINPKQLAPDYAGAGDDPMLASRGGLHDALGRGKKSVALDLKSAAGREALLALAQGADILISEMRPGKLEALGLGGQKLRSVNAGLILCEITGYGGQGPLAGLAGHDINYMALSGALSLIRDSQGKPIPPQNLVGDYAAGGTLAVSGILAALLARNRTGNGAHFTVSMTEGIRYLMSDIAAATLLAGHPEFSWRDTLSGGMPTYDSYETADRRWMAVGALEPKFIAVLAKALKWPELTRLMASKTTWPKARQGIAERFRTQSQAEWCEIFAGIDACVTPVLSLDDLVPCGLPDLGSVWSQEHAGGKEPGP